MFDFVRNGGSLNKVIESIICDSDNKQKQGITGYLAGGLYNRDIVDSDAVVSAFISLVFRKQREVLDKQILLTKKKKKLNIKK